jgi:hypothetical protein
VIDWESELRTNSACTTNTNNQDDVILLSLEPVVQQVVIFAFILEGDRTGSCSCTLFDETYETYGRWLISRGDDSCHQQPCALPCQNGVSMFFGRGADAAQSLRKNASLHDTCTECMNVVSWLVTLGKCPSCTTILSIHGTLRPTHARTH